MRLVAGQNEAVAKWVAARISFVGDAGFGACTGVGITDNDGHAIAGVVFHDYQPQFRTLAFSIAADTARWVTKRLIGKILQYPFEELGIAKLWTATPSSNERALRLAKGLGFTREAVLARHFGRDHAIINRMFTRDYMRIYGELNGKTDTARAA